MILNTSLFIGTKIHVILYQIMVIINESFKLMICKNYILLYTKIPRYQYNNQEVWSLVSNKQNSD